jgi:uncharacterized protein
MNRWLSKRLLWLALLLYAMVLVGLAWHDIHHVWAAPQSMRRVTWQLMIYWACWLVWPTSVWLCWRLNKQCQKKCIWGLGLTLSLLALCAGLAWARFIEPSLVHVRYSTLSSACGIKIALISDPHMGMFSRSHDLKRWVSQLNALELDAVLVAGDWTGEPIHDLNRVFAPLSKLRHRMLSVTGNHDEQDPGPPLTQALRQALSQVGVENIEGQRVLLGRCEVVGLGDFQTGSAEKDLIALAKHPSSIPPQLRLVLTHEPYTHLVLPKNYSAWLLAGHNHGGQINAPLLTDLVLPNREFRNYEAPSTQVFVTPGLGTSTLPFRFRVTPTIDVLSL